MSQVGPKWALRSTPCEKISLNYMLNLVPIPKPTFIGINLGTCHTKERAFILSCLNFWGPTTLKDSIPLALSVLLFVGMPKHYSEPSYSAPMTCHWVGWIGWGIWSQVLKRKNMGWNLGIWSVFICHFQTVPMFWIVLLKVDGTLNCTCIWTFKRVFLLQQQLYLN